MSRNLFKISKNWVFVGKEVIPESVYSLKYATIQKEKLKINNL
jgi:hypothetical protein